MKDTKIKCGDANPKGNIALFYKGGCKKEIDKTEAYRCVACGGWFHKECILKHFELEKKCDWGRQQEKKKWLKEIREIRKLSDKYARAIELMADGVPYDKLPKKLQ